MNHPICRVRCFEITSDFTLRVRFDDFTEQTIDFRPVLAGELYDPLRDVQLFNQVRVDPEVHTLVWPSGADFDPATLHDWPEHRHAFHGARSTMGARQGVTVGPPILAQAGPKPAQSGNPEEPPGKGRLPPLGASPLPGESTQRAEYRKLDVVISRHVPANPARTTGGAARARRSGLSGPQ